MVQEDDGYYVKYSDYAAIKAERDALASENKVLDSAIGAIAYAYEAGLKDLLAQEIDTAVNTTTPATDAYAGQLRAEGVDDAITHLCANGAITFGDCVVQLSEFAANLRKENGNE